jgi:quercetin dioxygenase-like cupin family protein
LFAKINDDGYRPIIAGIRIKALVFGEKTLLAEFRMDPGSALPRHAHPHEQTGYLIAGRLRLTIGEEQFEVGPGDSWCIPGNTAHGADIIEPSIAVEIFSPVREDYLPFDDVKPCMS